MSKTISYLKIGLYNFAVVIILFLLLEFAVRLFLPQIQPSFTSGELIEENKFGDSHGIKNSSCGESNGVKKCSDENGFWKYTSQKDSTASKVLIIGDSVTMGIGVESDSTFAGLMNNNLSHISVLNPSLIAYTGSDYKNVIRQLLSSEEIKFDRAILAWSLNDLYPRHPIESAPGIVSDNFFGNSVRLVRKNFRVYHLLKNLFTDRKREYFEYDKSFYSRENENFQLALSDIKEISDVLRDRNIPLKVLLMPYEYQLRMSNDSIYYPQHILSQELGKLDIPVIDCKDAFLEGANHSADYYLYGDGIHFSNLGHRELFQYLRSIHNKSAL
ncbi:MAG: hypothetical protein KJ799_17805 [Bacteroidetes bacterium]|nr:hypothetical protein [Bacteroidota bacterium]MBU2508554.1 hypothetical protein [Bacteroidota bacterium]